MTQGNLREMMEDCDVGRESEFCEGIEGDVVWT